MSLIFWRTADGLKEAQVTEDNPFPVSLVLGDPNGGALEYLGDAAMPVTFTGGMAPARRVVSTSFNAAAAGDYAAGDVVLGLDQISHAMGEGGVAATTMRNDLAKRQSLFRAALEPVKAAAH